MQRLACPLALGQRAACVSEILPVPGVTGCQVRSGASQTVLSVEALHKQHCVRLMLQLRPPAVLLPQIIKIVILPKCFAPIGRPHLRHEIGHGRAVRDQVAGVKIQHHMLRRLIDPAAVQKFIIEPVRAYDLPQHFAGVLTDPDDLGMYDAPRHIPHHRFSLLTEGKNRAENRITSEDLFQRLSELFRVHGCSRELHADRVARARLPGRVQDRVVEIGLIGRQILVP